MHRIMPSPLLRMGSILVERSDIGNLVEIQRPMYKVDEKRLSYVGVSCGFSIAVA